jgi:hypothetical protein
MDYQIHFHKITLLPIIHITAAKIIAAIIHLRVRFFNLDWICHRDLCRQNKKKNSNANKPAKGAKPKMRECKL